MSRGGHRGRSDDDSLSLFDLPLQGGSEAPKRIEPVVEPTEEPKEITGASGSDDDSEAATASGLFDQLAEADHHVDIDPIPPPPRMIVEPLPADLGTRLRAGLADLATIGLAVAIGAAGAAILGVSPTRDRWLPFAALACAFSFPYLVVPLAFWGQTPGMAWAGLSARADDDEPLTFRQTAWRWLGALITVLLAGLPLLLGLGGGTLADRLSGSKTVRLTTVVADPEQASP